MSSSNIDEYLVRVPKHNSKKYSVMRFNAGDKVDIRKWAQGTLSRDLSGKKIYENDKVYPEFGEGSEYGRKQREEARRLKYGGRAKNKFKVEHQPWNLTVAALETEPDIKKKLNGKVPKDIKPKVVTKDFYGKKEGGIGEGSMYFVFTQRPDFTFEAYPVQDWYNFNRKITHRTLTDEEAEAAWEKRDQIFNHLNYMARKRLHINNEDEDEEHSLSVKMEAKKNDKGGKKKSDLVIHDDEDLQLYMSGSSSEGSGGEDSTATKKKKKPKQKAESAEEALEDSDDGEHEGTEIAYASDISSENEETNDSKIAPRGLDELDSSSSEEEDEKSEEKKKEEQKNKRKRGSDDSGSSSASGSDIDNDDSLSRSALFMQPKSSPKDKKGKKSRSASRSRSATPTSESTGSPSTKSRLQDVSKKLEMHKGRQSPLTIGSSSSMLGKRGATTSTEEPVKRQKLNQSGSGSNTPTKDLQQHSITEETVKKYLTLKPITTKDLLKKFKKKKTGMTSEQIVEKVAKILKKLNPETTNLNGKMHLFLKQ